LLSAGHVISIKSRKVGLSALVCAHAAWAARIRDVNASVHLLSYREDAAQEPLRSLRRRVWAAKTRAHRDNAPICRRNRDSAPHTPVTCSERRWAVPDAGTGSAPPLVAVSNRLPVERGRAGWRPSGGGLVSALRPALEARGGAWVGWDGGVSGLPRRVEGLKVELCPLELDRPTLGGYYHGFSNRTLWPLLHGLVERSLFERRWWDAYTSANERFAAAALDQVGRRGDALLWVHDYHLMLVPALLRRHTGDRPIGFFLHVPFPAPELFARLPWREQLIDGVLGADVIAFQTEEYRDNFARTCVRLRRDVSYDEGRLRLPDGRTVVTAAHPISIDADALARDALTPPVERSLATLRHQFATRRVLLGGRPARLHQGDPRTPARDRAAARAAAAAAPQPRHRPDRRPQPRRGTRVS